MINHNYLLNFDCLIYAISMIILLEAISNLTNFLSLSHLNGQLIIQNE